jgi:hypothetical protein
MNDNDNKVPRGNRIYQAMNRVTKVLSEEFEELTPPELVFLFSWFQHRYVAEVEAIVSEREQAMEAAKREKHRH